jgi:membrane-associated phospholipid phosphatase
MRVVLPEKRWVGRFLLVLATLIATATVYGRYHYLADVAAGLALSLAALVLMQLVEGARVSGLGAVGGLRRG